MMAVTHRRKRYIFVCAGCGLLTESGRRDTISCSPACRVRLHRQPDLLLPLTQGAENFHITVGSILRAAAVSRLRPDLADAVLAGTASLDSVMPDVVNAFDLLVWKAAKHLHQMERTS